MTLSKTILRPLAAAAALALAVPGVAQTNLHGSFHEVDSTLKGMTVGFDFDGRQFELRMGGLFDIVFICRGEAGATEYIPDGVAFDCVLATGPESGFDCSVPARLELVKRQDVDVYDLTVMFSDTPGCGLSLVEGTTPLYRLRGERIDGTVPARVGDKVTMSGLLRSLAPYLQSAELMSTVMYLDGMSELSDTETVRHDERNRYLDYSFAGTDCCMDCKYWPTADGNVLLVMNFHDPAYECPQTMRYFLFDRYGDTVSELPTALSARWPNGQDAADRGICYQVRYSSDGIVALVPEADGDSFDIVTLKFDGHTFD